MSETPDDVDRLFARLERATVPGDFAARVLATSRQSTRTVLAWPWLVALLGALCLQLLAGYQLGVSLAATDGLDVVEAVFADGSLLATAPGDVVAALGEVLPKWLLAVAGVSAVLLVLAVGQLVSRTPPPLRARRLA